jgi:hypothetical protein
MTDVVLFTKEELKKALPTKAYINDNMVDVINGLLTDTDLEYRDNVRENFVTYSSVLLDGRYQAKQYANAIKYCTYKITGLTNREAYQLTFPERIEKFHLDGKVPKDIDSYISAYARSKLVTSILTQATVPFWLVNYDYRQKAVNVLVELMEDAGSEKVRADSANYLLNHLKPDPKMEHSLDITIKGGDVLDQLREQIRGLSSESKHLIDNGFASTRDIIEAEVVDV